MTRQGRRDQASLRIDQRNDPWGMPYFWFNFERPPSTLVPGTDLAAVDARRISRDAALPRPHQRGDAQKLGAVFRARFPAQAGSRRRPLETARRRLCVLRLPSPCREVVAAASLTKHKACLALTNQQSDRCPPYDEIALNFSNPAATVKGPLTP